MRKYVIGDVRGDIFLLKELLEKIGPASTDQLIFTGSYLGPGGGSKAVIDLILNLQKKLHVVCLRGCYEYVFKFCIETEPPPQVLGLWKNMQGHKVFASYSTDRPILFVHQGKEQKAEMELKIPIDHIKFIESQHQWFEDDTFPYIVTHCGGHPILFGGAMDREEQTVFSENGWWEQDGRRIPGKTVIFSHVPFKEPFRRAGKLGIDLGAGLGGKLCAFEMNSQSFTTVG